MAIKGLTDAPATFPLLGVIHKGAPKGEKGPGADLTYFRFESKDEQALIAFRENYGVEPVAIHGYAPYQTTDQTFEAWCEEYTAGGLKHRCDGEYVTIILQTATGKYLVPSKDKPMRCPGGCRPVGRLKVIIPELRRMGYVVVQTTSTHDIREISSNLRAIEEERGSLRWVPLVIRRVPREISTPGKEPGSKVRRTKWLIRVEARPEWVERQIEAAAQAALPSVVAMPEPLALPSWTEEEEVSVSAISPEDLEKEIKAHCMELFDKDKTKAKAFFDKTIAGLSYDQRLSRFDDIQSSDYWINLINDEIEAATARGVSQESIASAVDSNGGWGFDDLKLSDLRKILEGLAQTKGEQK
jgi:hypothetical protein